MSAYYNEIEPYPAQWLRNLITAGLIAPGEVDERSIVDVSADDVRGFTQCHFFAGIGIWSHALRLAGWPDDRQVWTGSCPCQPFSSAGRGAGIADARHLWPHFFRLIRERRPIACLGEQVSGADGLAWLDHVFLDLEAEAYTCGAISAPACSVGAPHIRQRLYWVAYPHRYRLEKNATENGICDAANDEGMRGRFGEMGGSRIWSTARPIGARPLAMDDGIAADVGRLRAYGNAIVAPQAAEFIKAAMSLMP